MGSLPYGNLGTELSFDDRALARLALPLRRQPRTLLRPELDRGTQALGPLADDGPDLEAGIRHP